MDLLIFKEGASFIAVIAAISAAVVGVLKFIINDFFDFKNVNKRKEESKDSLTKIIANLSSQENTSKLSAAIMLRRFLNTKISKEFPYLQTETINVIASMLKVLPTGVFQKTLADGLAYAVNLSNVDLQRTNLQDTYLGRKDVTRILMDNTDLYLSDLSYALIEHVDGKAIFYRSILFCTQIKNCDFSGATFREADLTNTCFKNVILKDADFTGAINIPEAIKRELVFAGGKSIYPHEEPVSAKHSTLDKFIFFSMPSVMSKENELLTKDYKTYLEGLGYEVFYYIKDDYPSFGQLNRIREKILASSAMVAFGFKQTNIHEATFRPQTNNEEKWNDKWLATPWNEIEVGMGLMKGMPILLVKDPHIDMGIFDSNLSECFVANVSTDDDSRKLAQNKEVVKWLSKITLMHPEELEFVVGSCRFKMIKVEGGTFTMGATAEQGDAADDDERPIHIVTLSDYYIGQTEVTQALWTAVMGSNPSKSKGDNLPVTNISWDVCQTFIEKLNNMLSNELDGKRFALPTEAQWEFAARGGNKSKGYTYAGSNILDDVAWFEDNSGHEIHPVAHKQPNELGLYDMSGNVVECCQDWYGNYSSDAQTNPQGPASGTDRVNRGGSWVDYAEYCRVSNRGSYTPGYDDNILGLRLCLIP